ncbi:MAG: hypothetical protein HY000_14120 [Planctomycetes bacterium]|nr:hypothetical protein [Planctomycetota bacterium]
MRPLMLSKPLKSLSRSTHWRLWSARVVILLITGMAAMKLADIGLGYARNTFERHLLRLPANVEVRHRSAEFDYTFRTNSLGLRGPELPLDKPAGVRRIVVLGDSFVAGWGVADEEVFTAKLQRQLDAESQQQAEVINVGRIGSSIVRQLDLYEAVGRRFDPDVVVLAYYVGNDLTEAMQEQDRAELARWHPDGMIRRLAYAWCPNMYLELAILRQAVEARRQFEPRTSDEILQTIREQAQANGSDPAAAVERYAAIPSEIRRQVEQGLLSQHRVLPACYDPERVRRALDPPDDYFQQAWPRTERHLELLRQAVNADGARLAIMAIPDAVQVDPDALEFDAQLGYQVDPAWQRAECRTARAVRTWAEGHNVSFLDPTDSLGASLEKCYYTRDQHFTVAGHALVAEALAQLFRRQ